MVSQHGVRSKKNTQLDKLDGLIKQQLLILMTMQKVDKFKASLGINQFPWLDIGLFQGKSYIKKYPKQQ